MIEVTSKTGERFIERIERVPSLDLETFVSTGVERYRLRRICTLYAVQGRRWEQLSEGFCRVSEVRCHAIFEDLAIIKAARLPSQAKFLCMVPTRFFSAEDSTPQEKFRAVQWMCGAGLQRVLPGQHDLFLQAVWALSEQEGITYSARNIIDGTEGQ
jgi:hypothetical protein